MAISAADVKKLREMTGAGMVDCKAALTETDGNFDEAVEYLRKKGLAKAEKKAGRIAAEGIVATVLSADEKTATIIEVNSETDFVAKNEIFQTYVNGLATQINNNDYADMAAFLAAKSDADAGSTVEEYHKAMVAKIGENLTDKEAVQDIVADFARTRLADKEVVQRFMDAGTPVCVNGDVSTATVNGVSVTGIKAYGYDPDPAATGDSADYHLEISVPKSVLTGLPADSCILLFFVFVNSYVVCKKD